MALQNGKIRFCVNVYCDAHLGLIATIRQQLQLLKTDFTIIVEQQPFSVHKLIMAMHSACIAALVSYGNESADHTETTLDGLAASSFRIILDWMYNGHIILRCSNVIPLYAAAIKYDIPKLTTLCIQFMIDNPGCSIKLAWNCIQAKNYPLSAEQGMKLISLLLTDAVDAAEFQSISKEDLWGILSSPFLAVSSENLSLWIILRWLAQDLESRHQFLSDMVHLVHINKLDGSTATEVMERCPVHVDNKLYPLFVEAMMILQDNHFYPEFIHVTKTIDLSKENLLGSKADSEVLLTTVPTPRRRKSMVANVAGDRSQNVIEVIESPSDSETESVEMSDGDVEINMINGTQKQLSAARSPTPEESFVAGYWPCCNICSGHIDACICKKTASVSRLSQSSGNSEAYVSLSGNSGKDLKSSPAQFKPEQSVQPGIEPVETENNEILESTEMIPDIEKAGETMQLSEKPDLSFHRPYDTSQSSSKWFMTSEGSSDSSSRISIGEIKSSSSSDASRRTLSSHQQVLAIPLSANILKVTTRINGDACQQIAETKFANDEKIGVAMDRCLKQDGSSLNNISWVVTRRIIPKLASESMAVVLETDIRCPGFDGEDGILMSMEVSVDQGLLPIRGNKNSDSESGGLPRRKCEEVKVCVMSEGGQKRSIYIGQEPPGIIQVGHNSLYRKTPVAHEESTDNPLKNSPGKVEDWFEFAEESSELLNVDWRQPMESNGNRQEGTAQSAPYTVEPALMGI